MKLDNLIKRRFTTGKIKVKDMFQWEERSVHLKDYKTGETIFKADDLLFPAGYSQNAVDIIASRYFRKKGVKGHPEEREHSLYQVAHRMVNFWTLSLIDEGILSTEQSLIFYDEVMYMILSQMFAPNSPQWFNTGLALSYGITGDPAGHWHWDEEAQDVVQSKDNYTRTQASACFIIDINDSLLGDGSITDNLTTETILFKGGSGVGTNFSTLRAEGEKLSSGGTSSGLMSFLKIFDTNAGAVKSGGACLAPWTKVRTVKGEERVEDLANKGEDFVVFSYNPIKKQVEAVTARAYLSGEKELFELKTDKGIFTLTKDHRVAMMGSNEYIALENLKPGMSIFGSYENFLIEVRENNHKVISITSLGYTSPVYDVEVDSDTPDDGGPLDGHNFAILTDRIIDNRMGNTGIFVHNSRRAAKMVIVDTDHPEILEFINWKAKEENKVEALIKMGYDGSIAGEAYETVSGQNSNNSIRLTDQFMEKIEDEDFNAPHVLYGRKDPSVNKVISVGEIWDQMNQASWRCADPAPQFHDTINEWHTCPLGEDGIESKKNQINGSNPCSEYLFLDNTSCNLGSFNLMRFLLGKTWDIESFLHAITMAQLVLEASIHWGHFPTKEIARRTEEFRTTGLGISNLAGVLLTLGIPYDSDEGRNLAAAIMNMLTGQSYLTSALMAGEIGPFKHYETNKVKMHNVIDKHAMASGLYGGAPYMKSGSKRTFIVNWNPPNFVKLGNPTNFKAALAEVWQNAMNYGKKYGYRNANVSNIAPVGTIGFAMDSDATSAEPFFAHKMYKKVVDGSYMTLTNPLIPMALENLGYNTKQIEAIVKAMDDGTIEASNLLPVEELAVFDTAMRNPGGSRFLSPMAHVKMVAALTPNVSGAISKTVNLPSDATVEDFKEVTLEAWRLGVKCISLYRDGSKAAQPLNVSLDQKVESKDLSKLSYAQLLEYAKNKTKEGEFISRRQKLEGVRKGTTHFAQIEDVKIYVTVNRDDQDKIREIFLTTDRSGTLITGLLNSLTKVISTMLQYNIHPRDISKMLRGQKYEPHGFVRRHPNIKNCSSISDLISKIIDIEIGDYSRIQVKPEVVKEVVEPAAKEIEGERVYGEICSNCSGDRLVNNGTCKVCLDCGETTGCS